LWQQSISKTTARLREKNLTESHKKKQKQIKKLWGGRGFWPAGAWGGGEHRQILYYLNLVNKY